MLYRILRVPLSSRDSIARIGRRVKSRIPRGDAPAPLFPANQTISRLRREKKGKERENGKEKNISRSIGRRGNESSFRNVEQTRLLADTVFGLVSSRVFPLAVLLSVTFAIRDFSPVYSRPTRQHEHAYAPLEGHEVRGRKRDGERRTPRDGKTSNEKGTEMEAAAARTRGKERERERGSMVGEAANTRIFIYANGIRIQLIVRSHTRGDSRDGYSGIVPACQFA